MVSVDFTDRGNMQTENLLIKNNKFWKIIKQINAKITSFANKTNHINKILLNSLTICEIQ